jgi:hypothetical protein
MSRDEQRLMLIAHALSGSAYRSTAPPASVAKRAIEIAGAVFNQLSRETEDRERKRPAPVSDFESPAPLRAPSRVR